MSFGELQANAASAFHRNTAAKYVSNILDLLELDTKAKVRRTEANLIADPNYTDDPQFLPRSAEMK